MGIDALARELKRGRAALLVLALLEQRERHGYDLARLIGERPERATGSASRATLDV